VVTRGSLVIRILLWCFKGYGRWAVRGHFVFAMWKYGWFVYGGPELELVWKYRILIYSMVHICQPNLFGIFVCVNEYV
jgi:hypothetical protein